MKRALCLNKIKIKKKKTLSLEHLKILKPQLGSQILSQNTHCTLHCSVPMLLLCSHFGIYQRPGLIENYQKVSTQYPQISFMPKL